ncbi:hypothetical protein OU798_07290 [Prolixibacteraceae bacterium Z1-6]|uniref:Uncharacterized protein n=1 Tax=Draconibacterium aestuarii TaxID=2998507 RepID=A0A9X3FC21_9BACT|nr:hypothetical protein [Prolixibacteraceae bacterium Z1-6]
MNPTRIWNTIENVGIAIITLLVINFFIIQPMSKRHQRQLDKQTEVIIELAKIEKYKIQNDFEKMKTHKGGQIVLDLDNTLNALELEAMPLDTIAGSPEKKGFFKRIFGGKE